MDAAVGLNPRDRDQFQRLENLFTDFRKSRSFPVRVELGLSGKLRALDRISFFDWLRQQGFDSRLLQWYMNYACRDDYGALANYTSAWAGIHYFSSREAEEKGPLTWPEGNGWITRRLLERVGANIRTSQMVHRITQTRRGVSVFAGDMEFQAEFVIFAAPTFLAPYLLEDFPRLHDFVYSPWLTANLTLDRYPESRGAAPSSVTVFLDSPALGYVAAIHQTLRTYVHRTAWTFYWALPDGAPAHNRLLLLYTD